MAQVDQFAGVTPRVSASAHEVLGWHFWARGDLVLRSSNVTDEMVKEYIEEQEAEQINDDSRFPIDSL